MLNLKEYYNCFQKVYRSLKNEFMGGVVFDFNFQKAIYYLLQFLFFIISMLIWNFFSDFELILKLVSNPGLKGTLHFKVCF